MKPRILLLSTLIAALFPDYASAIGLGQIVLHSRVGEPLRAEVPIIAAAGEPIDTACFSLANIPGADLPVVSNARVRLARNGSDARLIITGNRPLAEPVFIVALRAHCGIDLQRDYVLMPPPPVSLAMADGQEAPTQAAASPPSRKASRNFVDYRAQDGETLVTIAEARLPGDPAGQQRLLAALERANPNLTADQPLAYDTAVRIPNPRNNTAAKDRSESLAAQSSPAADAAPPAPRPKRTPVKAAPAPTGGADRLVLGAPPDELAAGEKAAPRRPGNAEMEERMLKLETTLQLLNQEVEKLNSALTLTTEALEAQHKLQTAQALQAPPSSVAPTVDAAVAKPVRIESRESSNWVELLTSALVGGGIAVGIAHLLGRRNRRLDEEDVLPALNGYRREVQPSPPPPSSTVKEQAPASAPPSNFAPAPLAAGGVDIPLETEEDEKTRPGSVAVSYDDGNSALELAEIMLSFGRLRGAADTLAQYIEENTPDNIQPWSMLLDLYRRGDMREEFESLAAPMRRRFNVHVPSWDDSSTPVSGLKSIEDYAHIIWRITNSWGSQECMDYLHDLVHDNRAGTRSGFPLEVVEEIVLLMRTLEEGYDTKRPD